MDVANLTRSFRKIGADVVVRPMLRQSSSPLAIDVISVNRREVFDVEVNTGVAVQVVDTNVALRHLLIHSRSPDDQRLFKFLCGHDERHWFVAGVPNDPGVSSVVTAMEALKPGPVREAQAREGVSNHAGRRRRNRAFLRQGEWFFVPAAGVKVDALRLRRNEPIRRSNAGKPHWAEWAFRTGGETVMVSHMARNGLTPAEHASLLSRSEAARRVHWVPMMRNPLLYVRGRVRHPDHATIVLDGWHRVLMNEESKAPSSVGVVFLD